jgi:hypothetical protein
LMNSRQLLEARQRPFPKYCQKLCNVASKEELNVWEITPKAGETDKLAYSMCLGASYLHSQWCGLIFPPHQVSPHV